MGINSVLRLCTIAICLILASCALTGCTYGLLYTASTSPYTLNFDKTPLGNCKPTEGAKIVSIPTTMLAAGWSDRAIGDAAKKAGLTEIYYADLHTYSILAGLWVDKTLLVYGK